MAKPPPDPVRDNLTAQLQALFFRTGRAPPPEPADEDTEQAVKKNGPSALELEFMEIRKAKDEGNTTQRVPTKDEKSTKEDKPQQGLGNSETQKNKEGETITTEPTPRSRTRPRHGGNTTRRVPTKDEKSTKEDKPQQGLGNSETQKNKEGETITTEPTPRSRTRPRHGGNTTQRVPTKDEKSTKEDKPQQGLGNSETQKNKEGETITTEPTPRSRTRPRHGGNTT
eukprot:Lankesteria_metandrocarpae@DN2254_c0_g1_i2.p1